MSTAYDPYGVPQPRQHPMDPLLNHPEHPSGVWSVPAGWPEGADMPEWPEAERPRVGHPRPARQPSGPHYPVVAAPGGEGPSTVRPALPGRRRARW